MADFQIQERETFRGTEYIVYEFGVYGRNSVLAGQTKKQYIHSFDSLEEAKEAYPNASFGSRSAHNTYSHLPSENDFVAGGAYPDDYDDGY